MACLASFWEHFIPRTKEEKLLWQAFCERKSKEREKGDSEGDVQKMREDAREISFFSFILQMKQSQNDAKQALTDYKGTILGPN